MTKHSRSGFTAIHPDLLDALAPDREFKQDGYRSYSVLDHGYLRVKNTWGSDEEIVETARMSTNKGFLGWEPGPCPTCHGAGYYYFTPSGSSAREATDCRDCGGDGKIPGDAKLLKFLYEMRHSTPFEFAGLTIEVQAPLMVFREWHRHRTQSYSEMSARYVQMPDLHYVPSVARIIASARKSKNRQASGAGVIQIPGTVEMSEEQMAEQIRRLIRTEQEQIYAFYEALLSFGVAKEVARLDTPVSRYSRMRATTDLRNWLGFLTLRMDPAAQFEIRQFAWCVADAIATAFPRTYELFFAGMTPILDPKSVEDQKKLLSDAVTNALRTLKRYGWRRLYALGGAPVCGLTPGDLAKYQPDEAEAVDALGLVGWSVRWDTHLEQGGYKSSVLAPMDTYLVDEFEALS